MRYLDGLGTIYPAEADNPLILGTAVHTGIERGLEAAITEYLQSYPVITDEQINEIIKLEKVIPLAREAIPKGGYFEVEIKDSNFIGYIDYLAPTENKNIFDLYDFKYSNNISKYSTSKQLHLYKYFLERNNPGLEIRDMYFLFVPKVAPKAKKSETLSDFRQRIESELSKAKISTLKVKYNADKVISFLLDIKQLMEATEFPRSESYICRFCEYYEYCEKGDIYMLLPKNERRNIEEVKKRTIWIYGAPFSGKTTFANEFPDPLMLNTDGNIKFVDAPFVRIKDEVRVEGRQTKRTLAWAIFKDTIDELEKKDNTFKSIVVDLLEDLYEHCRLYMYEKLGITHESDDSFRAWDKVRSEFLNTLKRLMNLDYENIILISHEDMTKDITKRTGDKITAIKPNLPDKVANKVAGMVDVVARIVADDDTRSFCFKSNEVVFGGGRLKVHAKDIPLKVDALFEVYDEANKSIVGVPRQTSHNQLDEPKPVETDKQPSEEKEAENEPSTVESDDTAKGDAEEPPRRRRRVRED